jgi:3-phytase
MCSRSVLLLPLAVLVILAAPMVRDIRPVLETEVVDRDVDDPAIWLNTADSRASLIVATVKRPKPSGALAVYSLDGKLLELSSGIDRPNNVDIIGDICVVTERLARQLRLYRVSPQKPHLRPLGTVPVFSGQPGESAAPMGVALYRRPADGALFAVVSRKAGPANGYLWQYQLHIDSDKVSGEKVRAFGAFSGRAEIEAVAVDQDRGLIYYADEDCCVRVYRADPSAADAPREIGRFAEAGFSGNREGIAIAGDLVIVTNQLRQRSQYHVYRRDGWQEVEIWRGMADMTDGIEAAAHPMGASFPKGLLVAMNSRRHNFHLYSLY